LISLGTLISFIKFFNVFKGEGQKSQTSRLRKIVILVLGIMCLFGGLFGEGAIKFLFNYSEHVIAGEYAVKAVIFIASVIASYFIYYKLLSGKKFVKKIGGFDLGINGIAMFIVVFFVVLTGYLYII
jgi:multicomponent Na+:H+ antiporter subunit D